MNKFLPQTGGHSLHLDEFVLTQNSFFDGFKAICSNFSDTGNIIFSGVYTSVVSSNLVWTDGYVALNGEIFSVAGGSITYNAIGTLYVKPVQSAIPPSPIQYEDGGLKNVHFSRTATIIYTDGSDTDGANYADMIRPSVSFPGDLQDWVLPAGHIISDYFDNTGLGINLRKGWAICNGLNGTPDLRGYGRMQATNVPAAGAGSLDGALSSLTNNVGDKAGINKQVISHANLPNVNFTVSDPGHVHHITGSVGNDTGFGSIVARDPNTTESGGNTDSATTGITVASGGSGTTFENRQPVFYCYTLIKLS